MKYLMFFVLLPFFAVAQDHPTHQNLYDTIPFIPEHTVDRLQFFSKQPMTHGGIIFFGNSITEGGNWQKLLNDTTVLNRGIGGDITFGALRRLDDVTNRQPDKLFILLGINDIGKDIPDSVIADNMFKIVKRVHQKSPATKIYVQSVLPINPAIQGFPQHYDKAEHIPLVNHLLQKNATALNYTYIDLGPVFMDANHRMDKKYTVEGLHLRQAGYEVWVNYLKKMKYL
ncbi:GDSL-type esterase/lipase family protein [Mucilaginibacter segetis]|uniref:SGNH hydrolase-type esterase domain-containing protein n=1 Tax=Mucilaginibacter segetis TaxID=2793071 RepID=A0A934PSF7_9SPHI|nr:GDSL-type esterase/lipase family protein [Mucilaginibacter segetis]MBK0378657.1 hypothetical protein [Mucilaginibacter segetis]